MRGGTELQKESVMSYIDELIDEGVDILNLRKDKGEKFDNAFKKRCARAFGGKGIALETYGFIMGSTPPLHVIQDCYYVNGDWKVVVDDSRKQYVCARYNLTDKEFRGLAWGRLKSLQKDALSEFYSEGFPEKTVWSFIMQKEYRHLKTYLVSIYDNSMIDFLVDHGVPEEIASDRDISKSSDSMVAGLEFENLVGEVFDALTIENESQRTIGNCRPDFILEDRWADAKLSYHTVFWRNCKTLEKYTAKTDKVDIIYALGAGSKKIKKFPSVELVHISEYYDALDENGRSDLTERIKEFIKENEEAI